MSGVVVAGAMVAWAGRDLPMQAGIEAALGAIRAAGPGWYFSAMAVLPLPLAWFTVPAGGAFAAQLTLGGVVAAALAAVAVQLSLSYALARFGLRPVIERLLRLRGLGVPRVTPANALNVALLVRLTPGPPMFLGSCVLAVAEMSFGRYLVVSWLVALPWVIGGVVLGRGILSGNVKLAAAGLGLLAVAIVVVRWWRRRRGLTTGANGLGDGSGNATTPPAVSTAPAVSEVPPAPPPYRYRGMDESRLSAWIGANVAPRVERWVVQAWSANTITWVGSGLMWVLLAGVLGCAPETRGAAGGLWCALLWGYCVLDHVDGCRARLRGTSAAWGEFLDHGLDACHGSIIIVVLAAVSGATVQPGVTALALACAGVATVATWLEQRWRGEFYFGKLGPVESVFLAGCFLITWMWPTAADWWREPLFAGNDLSRAAGFFLVGAAGAVGTAAMAWRRAPGVGGRLAYVVAVAGAVVVSGAAGVSWWVVWLTLALVTADAGARILTSHLTQRAAPWTDGWGAALLVTAAAWPEARTLIEGTALVWLLGRVVLAWRSAVMTLRSR